MSLLSLFIQSVVKAVVYITETSWSRPWMFKEEITFSKVLTMYIVPF